MKVQICNWRSCREKQSLYIKKRLENDKHFYAWENIEIENGLCMWNCERAPNLLLEGVRHEKMNPIKSSELLRKQFNSQI